MTTRVSYNSLNLPSLDSVRGPRIVSLTYPNGSAASTSGGDTIIINGSGFAAGCSVYIANTRSTLVTFVSRTQVTFLTPALTAATYILYLYNPDGATATYMPGISFSSTPIWGTAAGSIGTVIETSSVSASTSAVAASSNSTVRYLINSGSLPPNTSLNTITGVVTGTAPAVPATTIYNFVVAATDNENQATLRSFSITIIPDTITWATPQAEESLYATELTAFSKTISAVTTSGNAITYSITNLPTGFSLVGNLLSGTSSTVGVTKTTFTANCAANGRSLSQTVYISVTPDVVTWVTPAAGTTFNATVGVSFSQSLSATTLSGQGVTYASSTLPLGLTISGNTITGIPTVGGTFGFVVNATTVSASRSTGISLRIVVAFAVPGVPTSVVATQIGSDSVSIAFSAPAITGGIAIDYYTATSSPGAITATALSTPIYMRGLTGGTTYSFTVKATNSIGSSNASTSSTPIVMYTVPDAPTITSVIRGGSGTAIVNFTAGANNGGSTVFSNVATSNPGAVSSTAAVSPITVSGLTNGTSYTFLMYAINNAGNSANSNISSALVVGTTPAQPTGLSAVRAGNNSIAVSYIAPSDNGGFAVTSYTAVSNPGNITASLSQAGSGTITVNGLTNAASYTFTVYATNSLGNGTASVSSNISSTYTVPPAPGIGTATRAGANSITVTYTAPSDNGGYTITSYTVISSPGGITGSVSQSGSGSITVNGLTTGTFYTFLVYATNALGNSTTGGPSNSSTTYTVPPVPTIGTATSTGSSSASVPFTAPADNGGTAITSYTATAYLYPSGTAAGITGTLSQAGSGTITINGLASGTSYTFTVYATNAVGNSTATGSSNAITTTATAPAAGALEYLVVAGGGGGGSAPQARTAHYHGGGGGAGGYLSGNTSVSSGTPYTVTVGGGGPGVNKTIGTQGSNSTFGGITSTGGGYGGMYLYGGGALANGGDGGSGGGAGRDWGTYGNGIGGQGNRGSAPGGGGGGAGAVGVATGQVPKGGDGLISSITGTGVYYAGGGGGGNMTNLAYCDSAGGAGGGGTGRNVNNCDGPGGPGQANTGGGGGAGGCSQPGGDGGSGIVIIAYPDNYLAPAAISGGLSYDQPSRSGYRVYRFLSGTGTITW